MKRNTKGSLEDFEKLFSLCHVTIFRKSHFEIKQENETLSNIIRNQGIPELKCYKRKVS